jgi:branched-chain amino acid transport system ATP-binding protein
LSLLEIRGLKVAYGGIEAVRGIDLEVAEGELVALIGANGAGKTTTLKAIAGMLRPTAGTLRYDGEEVTGLPSHRLIRRGIALVPEGRGVFARLTVEENLAMGAYIRDDRPAIAREAGSGCGHALWRRAADAGHRAGDDEPTPAIAAR